MTKKPEKTQKEVSTLSDNIKQEIQTDPIEALKQELQKMQKELVELRSAKREFTDAEKQAAEEARDEMLLDDDVGSLFIDDKYKEEGYFYTIVDASRPGRLALRIRQGYEVVEDPDLKVGSSSVNNTNRLGSAVTVELGRTNACQGILMRCPLDLYNRRQAAKARKIRETDASMVKDMVNKSDFGSIEIGSDVYKK